MLSKEIGSVSLVILLLLGPIVIVDQDPRLIDQAGGNPGEKEISIPVRSDGDNETIWPMFQYDL
jgi:hypothetical protein